MTKVYFFSLLLSFAAAALARPMETSESLESLYLSLGSHTEFYNALQKDQSGNKRRMDFNPTLGLGLALNLPSSAWRILPEFIWVLPQEAGSNKIIKNIFMLRGDLAYDLHALRIRLGTSFVLLNQHGLGGSAELDNGNSTSTFYYPEENRSSLNNTVDLGLELIFNPDWSTRLQTYTYSLFAEEQRQISYTLFLTYHWPQR
jgi:hypothetical protein